MELIQQTILDLTNLTGIAAESRILPINYIEPFGEIIQEISTEDALTKMTQAFDICLNAGFI